MSTQDKENMKNLGCGGFLIKKTIQPNSLRQNFTDAQQYKNTNMILYLNKKFAEIRKRLGKSKVPSDLLQSACLRIKPQKITIQNAREFFQVDHNKLLDQTDKKDYFSSGINKKILEEIRDKQVADDFEINYSSKPIQKKKVENVVVKPIDPSAKLFNIFSDEITTNQLDEWFKKYQNVKLSDRLNQLKEKTYLKDKHFQELQQIITEAIKRKETKSEIKQYVSQVCKQENIQVQDILKVDKNDIKFQINEEQQMKEDYLMQLRKKSRRISKRAMQFLIQKNQKSEDKQLVEVFQQTRFEKLEDVNKFSKADMTKKKKQQDLLYNRMRDEFKQEVLNLILMNNEPNPQRFLREEGKSYINKTTSGYGQKLLKNIAKNYSKDLRRLPRKETITRINSAGIMQKVSQQAVTLNKLKSLGVALKQQQTLTSQQLQKIQMQNNPYSVALNQTQQPKLSFFSTVNILNNQVKQPNVNANNNTASQPNLIKNSNQLLKEQKQLEIAIRQNEKLLQEQEYQGALQETVKLQTDFENLLEKCEHIRKHIKKDKPKIKQKLKQMAKQTTNVVKNYEKNRKNLNKKNLLYDTRFQQFQVERDFKIELINYLSDQVADKKDLISKYAKQAEKIQQLEQLKQQEKEQMMSKNLQKVKNVKKVFNVSQKQQQLQQSDQLKSQNLNKSFQNN